MACKPVEYRGDLSIDVVLVQNSNPERGDWHSGIVKSASPSRDGKVRTVTIECFNGSSNELLE